MNSLVEHVDIHGIPQGNPTGPEGTWADLLDLASTPVIDSTWLPLTDAGRAALTAVAAAAGIDPATPAAPALCSLADSMEFTEVLTNLDSDTLAIALQSLIPHLTAEATGEFLASVIIAAMHVDDDRLLYETALLLVAHAAHALAHIAPPLGVTQTQDIWPPLPPTGDCEVPLLPGWTYGNPDDLLLMNALSAPLVDPEQVPDSEDDWDVLAQMSFLVAYATLVAIDAVKADSLLDDLVPAFVSGRHGGEATLPSDLAIAMAHTVVHAITQSPDRPSPADTGEDIVWHLARRGLILNILSSTRSDAHEEIISILTGEDEQGPYRSDDDPQDVMSPTVTQLTARDVAEFAAALQDYDPDEPTAHLIDWAPIAEWQANHPAQPFTVASTNGPLPPIPVLQVTAHPSLSAMLGAMVNQQFGLFLDASVSAAGGVGARNDLAVGYQATVDVASINAGAPPHIQIMVEAVQATGPDTYQAYLPVPVQFHLDVTSDADLLNSIDACGGFALATDEGFIVYLQETGPDAMATCAAVAREAAER
jgi:hypothetical protein